jgi:hypothetical protein
MGYNINQGLDPGKIQVFNPVTRQNEWIDLTDWTESVIVDSENIPAGTVITAQQQLVLFSNLNHQITTVAKLRPSVECNLVRPNQLPASWKMIVKGLHLGIVSAGEVPIQQHRAYLDSVYGLFRINNQRTEREGPMSFFGFPYGLGGMVAADGALGAVERTVLSNGVVAPTAQHDRLPIYISDNMTFDFTASFAFAIPAVINLVPCVAVRLTAWMVGYIQKPVM